MQALLQSFFLVFAGEMGDKTQLLALVLAARFRKPFVILLGVLVATVLNHALAAWAGAWVASFFSATTMKWALALTFFGFGLWILVPDKEGEVKETGSLGAFLTTVVSFFLAEMGDKTQLATVALGARFEGMLLLVTAGTTAGMLASNALAIFLGDRLLARVPMKKVRVISCVMFLAFGVGILVGF